ncbi:hypothetical protein MCY_00246 [Bartonella rattimassiliensis 15908]|uniref:Branched-chain amino acid transport system / permease component n=1 Tax=Bartonella rattimassiliensis 15908 TaxID=1094556 RepID=J1JQN3_9HYPH|nr:hypothetical protein [Bartonella rattimassiliensis]EJF87122.1 hypothetical protein MCY_00246 [Bartonella rattimassiliensis 15908]
MNILAFSGAVELGLIYAFVVIGVYLSFRVLDFSELIYFGMVLSNAWVALGGSLYIQTAIATDIIGGIGTIILGLDAVIIGEALFRTRNIFGIISSCIVGSVLYRVAV